ncbi:MAG: efflux RND transporter periplasmic adaptor subunit [Chromatiales bacterium]|nr:efflux RND transporter periplasmic adaptor subunit [Chromatiales bacterium]
MMKSSPFSNRPWLVSLLLASVVAVWMVTGMSGGNEQQDGAAPPPDATSVPEVQVRSQEAEWITRYVILYGRTAPARSVDLKAETQGRVVAFGAQRGEQVDEGAVLVRLSERDRKARLAEARAVLAQRAAEFEAQQKLKLEGYISDTLLAEGAANLERARAELNRAELDLQYMTVRAPFAGALQERVVEIGDYVAAGDPVATFVDNNTLVVTASVSEKDIESVSAQDVGAARLITGHEAEGKIRYIAPVAEAATRTFTIELELDNSDGNLPAGVTAELRIPTGDVLAQKVSPALLTLDEEGNLGLKTVDKAGRVEFFAADVVKSSNDGVWIAGLPEKANIITVGQGFVRDGERVAAVDESLDERVMTAESP